MASGGAIREAQLECLGISLLGILWVRTRNYSITHTLLLLTSFFANELGGRMCIRVSWYRGAHRPGQAEMRTKDSSVKQKKSKTRSQLQLRSGSTVSRIPIWILFKPNTYKSSRASASCKAFVAASAPCETMRTSLERRLATSVSRHHHGLLRSQLSNRSSVFSDNRRSNTHVPTSAEDSTRSRPPAANMGALKTPRAH